MIHSMTAFARLSLEKSWGSAVTELRTVNHRYFEMDCRLPELFRELEMTFRERAAHYLKRGKIECHLRFKLAETSQKLSINPQVVQQLANINHELAGVFRGNPEISLTQLLNWPGVLENKDTDTRPMHADLLTLFDETLQAIGIMRLREGQALKTRIQERLQLILQEITTIKQHLPIILLQQRQKILARIEEFKLHVETHRLEEELLPLLHKMDVTEEVERLEIHVDEVYSTLNTRGAVGRRLDFLMQELHREANTLGSKSLDAKIAHAVIHLKVLIEQMREQVQNIE